MSDEQPPNQPDELSGRTLWHPFWEYVAGLRNIVVARGVTMSEAKIDNVITPGMVLETGRKLRKAWLATLSPEEIMQLITRVPPEIRLANLPPEERLAGLAPEKIKALVKQLEVYLHEQPSEIGESVEPDGQAPDAPPANTDE